MRTGYLLPLLLLAASGLAVAQGRSDDAAGELKKREGTWVLVSGKKDGQPIAADSVGKSRIVWKGQDVVVETPHQAKEPIKTSATLAAGGRGTMDWSRANGPDAGKTRLAIYQFRGPDEYVVVFAPAGKARPQDFDTKAGSGHTLHVWKRTKG
ncbi:MAG: TIGR03067 domain-containing protein [Betaproteobacteria bacterium]